MKNLLIWAAVIVVVWILLPSWIFKAAIGFGFLYFGYKLYLQFGGTEPKFVTWIKSKFWNK